MWPNITYIVFLFPEHSFLSYLRMSDRRPSGQETNIDDDASEESDREISNTSADPLNETHQTPPPVPPPPPPSPIRTTQTGPRWATPTAQTLVYVTCRWSPMCLSMHWGVTLVAVVHWVCLSAWWLRLSNLMAVTLTLRGQQNPSPLPMEAPPASRPPCLIYGPGVLTTMADPPPTARPQPHLPLSPTSLLLPSIQTR